MADDVLLNKAATIERCVSRAKQEYHTAPETFDDDFTRQDAAILNIQRACEATLDMGQHVIREYGMGIPQSARDIFSILAQSHVIDVDLADKLQRMVGFRNIAVHEYQTLQLPITIAIIQHHLDDFLIFTKALIHWSKAHRKT